MTNCALHFIACSRKKQQPFDLLVERSNCTFIRRVIRDQFCKRLDVFREPFQYIPSKMDRLGKCQSVPPQLLIFVAYS